MKNICIIKGLLINNIFQHLKIHAKLNFGTIQKKPTNVICRHFFFFLFQAHILFNNPGNLECKPHLLKTTCQYVELFNRLTFFYKYFNGHVTMLDGQPVAYMWTITYIFNITRLR